MLIGCGINIIGTLVVIFGVAPNNPNVAGSWMLVQMIAYYRRRDRDLLAAGRVDIEQSLAAAHRHEPEVTLEVATAQRLPIDQDHPND